VLHDYREKGSGKLPVTGHSLGAARASVLCGLAVAASIVRSAAWCSASHVRDFSGFLMSWL